MSKATIVIESEEDNPNVNIKCQFEDDMDVDNPTQAHMLALIMINAAKNANTEQS